MILEIKKIETLEKLCEENNIKFSGFEFSQNEEDKDITYIFYTKSQGYKDIRFDIEFTNGKITEIYINKMFMENETFNAIFKIKEYLEKNEKEE